MGSNAFFDEVFRFRIKDLPKFRHGRGALRMTLRENKRGFENRRYTVSFKISVGQMESGGTDFFAFLFSEILR